MTIRHVLRREEAALHEPSEKVVGFEAASTIVTDLWDTLEHLQGLHEFSRGIGIGAPQIGELQRISVVEYQGNRYPLINPEVVGHSDAVINISEGCLSFFTYRGVTERFESVTIRAFDLHKAEFTIDATGDFSMLLQHEVDHLDGILCDQRLALGETMVKIEGVPEIP